jgi:predicted nicotinamide N-methyase
MTRQPNRRTAFGIKILNSNHKEIRRLKREGHVAELHGNKFWNSSFLIMDYLKKNPPKQRTRVLEIGCGWGLLGIYCAKNFDARVTGIDADKNVLPYLAAHAEINQVKVDGKKMSFHQLSVEKLKDYDLIIGADICYWDEMTTTLFNLIARAKKAGVKQVMISDPCRPPFTDLVEKCRNRYPEDQFEVVEKFLKRPVHASGEILIVR